MKSSTITSGSYSLFASPPTELPEGRGLMKKSYLGLSVPRVFLTLSHCPIVGPCICTYLLQEEASPMMTEQGTVLWVQQNAKSLCIAMFL